MNFKNALVAQSGGPTAAINATLAGVIRQCRKENGIGCVYGAINGIEGLLEGKLADIGRAAGGDENLDLLIRTPAMALGSCRYRLSDPAIDKADYEKVEKVLKKYNIGYVFYIGGNDSMDTANKLAVYLSGCLPGIKVIGIPKTIDNDLTVTDHTPGFGSAAKFVATAMLEIVRDCRINHIPSVTIVEVMGRHAGWLAAAAALPNYFGVGAPQMVYLPEIAFDAQKFIADVKERVSADHTVIIAVSEGVKTQSGEYLCFMNENVPTDAFGHKSLSGAGRCLEHLVREQIGCKVRSVELNILQRCASHCASLTDLTEAQGIGAQAVKAAAAGHTGKLVYFKRVSDDPYTVEFGLCGLSEVANLEKPFPREWINENGNGITERGYRYILPLIKGTVEPVTDGYLPKHFVLESDCVL